MSDAISRDAAVEAVDVAIEASGGYPITMAKAALRSLPAYESPTEKTARRLIEEWDKQQGEGESYWKGEYPFACMLFNVLMFKSKFPDYGGDVERSWRVELAKGLTGAQGRATKESPVHAAQRRLAEAVDAREELQAAFADVLFDPLADEPFFFPRAIRDLANEWEADELAAYRAAKEAADE